MYLVALQNTEQFKQMVMLSVLLNPGHTFCIFSRQNVYCLCSLKANLQLRFQTDFVTYHMYDFIKNYNVNSQPNN